MKVDRDKVSHVVVKKRVGWRCVTVKTMSLEESEAENKRMQEKSKATKARNNQYRYRIMQVVRDNEIRDYDKLVKVLRDGGEEMADLYGRVMEIGCGQAKWYIEDAWKRC